MDPYRPVRWVTLLFSYFCTPARARDLQIQLHALVPVVQGVCCCCFLATAGCPRCQISPNRFFNKRR